MSGFLLWKASLDAPAIHRPVVEFTDRIRRNCESIFLIKVYKSGFSALGALYGRSFSDLCRHRTATMLFCCLSIFGAGLVLLIPAIDGRARDDPGSPSSNGRILLYDCDVFLRAQHTTQRITGKRLEKP